MTINKTLKKASPPLLKRLYPFQVKEIAKTHGKHIDVVRRILNGKGLEFGYTEKNIRAILFTALKYYHSNHKENEKLLPQLEKDLAA